MTMMQEADRAGTSRTPEGIRPRSTWERPTVDLDSEWEDREWSRRVEASRVLEQSVRGIIDIDIEARRGRASLREDWTWLLGNIEDPQPKVPKVTEDNWV